MVHGMVAGRAFVHRKMTFSQALKVGPVVVVFVIVVVIVVVVVVC